MEMWQKYKTKAKIRDLKKKIFTFFGKKDIDLNVAIFNAFWTFSFS